MINPPKPPEGPKPTKAQFTSLFQHPSPCPSTTHLPPKPLPPPPPPTNDSIQATASSQDPLLSNNSLGNGSSYQ